jgi:hypothetical protein
VILYSITCTDIETTFYVDASIQSAEYRALLNNGSLIWWLSTWTIPATSFIASYNLCTPWLSLPPQALAVDPRMSTCNAGNIFYLRDPPRYLATLSGFFPITTADPTPTLTAETMTASGRATISHTFATKTLPPATHQTSRLADNLPPPQDSKFPTCWTIGTIIIMANSDSAFVIDNKPFRPDGKITYSGATLSLASDGQVLYVDGTTRHPNICYTIRTQTIHTDGAAVTVSGTTFSVPPRRSLVVIDGLIKEFNM